MEFSPFNPIVRLCLQGMEAAEKNNTAEASEYFQKAWSEGSSDFDRYLAAYYVATLKTDSQEKLEWLTIAVEHAEKSGSESAKTAYASLHIAIAACYQHLGETAKSAYHADLAKKFKKHPTDPGPFYHGTKANLKRDDLLQPGGLSNYQSDLKMNHIYFTAMPNGAGLAAALAKGDAPERVYIIQPLGDFENDPNVTDKKFPGNPTRSYRSADPLKIIGELSDWQRPTEAELQHFKKKLENNNGEIIN